MLILTLLLMLLSSINANAVQNDKLDLQGPYILPRYPERAIHARIIGLFGVKVTVSQGRVDSVRILGRQTLWPGAWRPPPKETMTPEESIPEFRKAIEESLRSWKFGKAQSGSFPLEIYFMPKDSSQENDKAYTSYRIVGLPNGPPTQIIVEAHQLFHEATK